MLFFGFFMQIESSSGNTGSFPDSEYPSFPWQIGGGDSHQLFIDNTNAKRQTPNYRGDRFPVKQKEDDTESWGRLLD